MKNVDGPAVRLVDESDEQLAMLLPETLAVELSQIAAVCRRGRWRRRWRPGPRRHR